LVFGSVGAKCFVLFYFCLFFRLPFRFRSFVTSGKIPIDPMALLWTMVLRHIFGSMFFCHRHAFFVSVETRHYGREYPSKTFCPVDLRLSVDMKIKHNKSEDSFYIFRRRYCVQPLCSKATITNPIPCLLTDACY
jgi:hypothetical protein